LCENNALDIVVIGGGTIPDEDIADIISKGYAKALFSPGTSTADIVSWIQKTVAEV